MARSRNIKPAFFTNEKMAEIDPLGRLLFIGLTTLADYKGDLEWRPKRIKIQILPYDDCSIESLAINLDRSRFIRFYSDGEKTYVHIANFAKHQNPHKNEREQGSDVPEFSESLAQAFDISTIAINTGKIGITLDGNGTAPADSLNLIPDSLSKTTLSTGDAPPPAANRPPPPLGHTLVPDDYQPPADIDARLFRAGKRDINPRDPMLLAKFISHHQGIGTTSPDWDAKFVNWCLREYKPAVATKGGRSPPAPENFETRDYGTSGRMT